MNGIAELLQDLRSADPLRPERAKTELLRQGVAVLPALKREIGRSLQVAGMPSMEGPQEVERAQGIILLLEIVRGIDVQQGAAAMRMALADRSEEVRKHAIAMMLQSGRFGFLALEEALDEGEGSAQEEAAWALARLGSPDAIAALSQGLGSRRPALQVACAHALFEIAVRNPVPELRLAVRRLEELARFGQSSPLPVRETCRQTLQRINAVTQPDPYLPIPAEPAHPRGTELPIPHLDEVAVIAFDSSEAVDARELEP